MLLICLKLKCVSQPGLLIFMLDFLKKIFCTFGCLAVVLGFSLLEVAYISANDWTCWQHMMVGYYFSTSKAFGTVVRTPTAVWYKDRTPCLTLLLSHDFLIQWCILRLGDIGHMTRNYFIEEKTCQDSSETFPLMSPIKPNCSNCQL